MAGTRPVCEIDDIARIDEVAEPTLYRVCDNGWGGEDPIERVGRAAGSGDLEIMGGVAIPTDRYRFRVARQSGWRSATIRMTFGNRDELIIRRRSDGGKRYVWS